MSLFFLLDFPRKKASTNNKRVSEKRNENETHNAQAVVLMAGAFRIWKFVKSNLLRVYDVDLLGLFTIFNNQFRASCGRPQCVLPPFAETCFSSSSIPITHSPPSPLSKPPPSSRLRVLFFVSCVMSIYLSIDLSAHFSPGLLAAAAAGFVCYTAATVLLAATS